jgi:hypothetical protein
MHGITRADEWKTVGKAASVPIKNNAISMVISKRNNLVQISPVKLENRGKWARPDPGGSKYLKWLVTALYRQLTAAASRWMINSIMKLQCALSTRSRTTHYDAVTFAANSCITFATVLLVILSRSRGSRISHPKKSSIDRGFSTTVTEPIWTKFNTTAVILSKNFDF